MTTKQTATDRRKEREADDFGKELAQLLFVDGPIRHEAARRIALFYMSFRESKKRRRHGEP